MNILKKVQAQSLRTRKIILWLIVIILGVTLLIFWAKNFSQRLRNLDKAKFFQEIQMPSFGEELKGIEKPEIEGNLQELEELIKKAKEE